MRIPSRPCPRSGSLLLALLAALLLAPSALAQFNASINGTVQDTSGAVISGATATLTNTQTQAVKTTTSSAQGFYSFTELAPGSYSLSVTAKGFQTTTLPVTLSAEAPRGIDVKLQIGSAAQTVTVSASDVPVLDTTDGNVGTSISSADVTRLPAFGRDPYELLRMTPGTTMDAARSGTGGSVALPNAQGPGQSNFGIFQTENQVEMSAAGQRVTSNDFLVDGVSVDSLLHGGSAIVTPNPESVAQITTTSSDFDATEGRNVGAHIRTTTKSGTNDLHGSLFFQYDDPGLNAFQPYGGPDGALPLRVENKQREWAASLGAPIVKNRLFFFGSYEGVTNQNNTYSEQYIPTPQFLAGIGALRPNAYNNPLLIGPGAAPRVIKSLPTLCANVQPPTTSTAIPNPPPVCQEVAGGVDIGSFSGAAGAYLPAYNAATPAVPNLLTGGGLDGIPDIQYAEIVTPARFRGNQFNGRIDWTATSRDQVTFSAFFSKLDQTSGDPSTGAQPLSDLPFKPLNSSATAIWIHTFGPNLINEARGNVTRFADNQVTDSKGVVNWGLPRLEVQGFTFGRLENGAPDAPGTPGIFAENTYEFRDKIDQTFGNHTLAYGGLIRWEQDNDNLSAQSRPDYVFQNMWNFANSAPIFEQIAANPVTGGTANAQRYFRDHDIAFFLQHDWKVTPNFTFNTGLRWENFEPLYNKSFNINEPIFGSTPATYLTTARLAPVNHLFNSNYNNWGPKLSFAWNPNSLAQKFVLRGGFGISYDRLDDQLFINGYENGPGYFLFGLCCATDAASLTSSHITLVKGSTDSPFSYAPNPNLAVGTSPTTGLPNGAGEIEVYGASDHTAQPMLMSYSLQTEYQLPHEMVATIAYQGSLGHHFPRLVDQNFLYPTCAPVTSTGACASTGATTTPFNNAYIPTTDVFTNYNGVNFEFMKRFSHGWNVNAFYTFAKSLDQGSNEGPGALSNQTNPAHPRTEYGPSDFDVRHRVTVSGNWNLPRYHGGKGFIGEVFTGWELNGIYTWHTGFPWTPVTGVPTVAFVQSAATIAPTRPTAYFGGAHNSCSNNAYINQTNFPGIHASTTSPGLPYFLAGPNAPSGQPGIGRNSWNGPCYMDTDLSFAKSQPFAVQGHEATFRFQANAYNVFNKTNLLPIVFGSPNATIENTLFGYSPGADAGRVIEFFARIDF